MLVRGARRARRPQLPCPPHPLASGTDASRYLSEGWLSGRAASCSTLSDPRGCPALSRRRSRGDLRVKPGAALRFLSPFYICVSEEAPAPRSHFLRFPSSAKPPFPPPAPRLRCSTCLVAAFWPGCWVLGGSCRFVFLRMVVQSKGGGTYRQSNRYLPVLVAWFDPAQSIRRCLRSVSGH